MMPANRILIGREDSWVRYECEQEGGSSLTPLSLSAQRQINNCTHSLSAEATHCERPLPVHDVSYTARTNLIN